MCNFRGCKVNGGSQPPGRPADVTLSRHVSPICQPMFPFNPLALFGGMGGFNPAAFSLTTGNDEAKSGAAGSDIKQEVRGGGFARLAGVG